MQVCRRSLYTHTALNVGLSTAGVSGLMFLPVSIGAACGAIVVRLLASLPREATAKENVLSTSVHHCV